MLTKKEREEYEKSKVITDRICELERIAKNKYCEYIDWEEIINMLSEDDQEEYYKLTKEINLFD